MNRIQFVIAFLFSLLFIPLNAQNTTIGDSTSRWKLGLNSGLAFQQSDVRTNFGYGLGTTLEWALIQNSHSAIGMSLRGRYLYSTTFGKDYLRSTGIQNNPILNGESNSSTDYASSPGYIYMNHKTKSHNIDLELMLIANRLRMKGILLYGFGGVGFMPFKTYYNQLGADLSKYDYSLITGTQKQEVLNQLNSLRDKTFETPATRSNKAIWAFAPSFGAGFGFYLSPYVVLGFEHKVTLPNTDELDGQKWNNLNLLSGNNDIHHYTNLFFRIDLGHGRVRHHHHTDYSYYNPVEQVYAPELIISIPASRSSHSCAADIRLTVKNVTSESDVQVFKDGFLLPPGSYLFNPQSGYFSLSMPIEGNSIFEIIAKNSSGTRTEKIYYYCTPTPVTNPITTAPPLPIITITNPLNYSNNAYDCRAAVIAQIHNIQGKNNIQITQNGRTVSPGVYNYNSSNGILSFSIPFEYNAKFVITAFNVAGRATASVEFNCQPRPVKIIPKPVIIIRQPTQYNSISTNCVAEIVASIQNIESKFNIEVKVNGIVLSSSNYKFNPAIGDFYLTYPIQGANSFTITASNQTGTAVSYVTIKCEPPVIIPATPKPVVIINYPTNNPHISKDCKADISATLLYIDSQNNIDVKQNGVSLSSNNYFYDRQTKNLRILHNFNGVAVYTITAVNASGSTSVQQSFKCEAAAPDPNEIPKPIIIITAPGTNPHISKDCKVNLTATIQYVDGKQNIELRQNGEIIPSNLYEFDPASRTLIYQNISKQVSVFSITAANSSGVSSASTTIKCEQQPSTTPKNKPVVTITSPAQNPYIACECKATIKASIQYVSSKNDIEVRRNGQIIPESNYSYNTSTKEFIFTTDINQVSVFTITAANTVGITEASTTIKCEPKTDVVTKPTPTVTITSPSENPFISKDCKATIKAIITDIDGKGNIEIKVNGQIINSSLYTYDVSTKVVTFTTTIAQVSVVSIQAANVTGIASATTTIKCEPPIVTKPKPIVTITSPANNSTSENCKVTLIATIKNIENKNELVVKQDNQLISSDLIEFNSSNKSIKVPITFSGTSVFTVVAGNTGGYDSSSVTITCVPKVEIPKPTVVITSPEPNYLANDCKATITATVQHIESKSNLVVKQGGNILPEENYSYNASTKVLSIHSTLKETSIFEITATTISGSANAFITIRCIPVVAVPKPTVSITSPEPNYLANDCKANITATIQNIESKSNLVVRQGGNIVPESDYSYNADTKVLSIHSTLNETSIFEITATNVSGTASAAITIRCIPVVAVPKPVVIITSPEPNYLANDCKAHITASIQNIDGVENIVVKQGNNALPNDKYSYNTSSKVLTINSEITASTVFEITASNASGTAASSITIRCTPKEEVKAPEITITKPVSSPYESPDCIASITALIKFIESKENISVTLNGTTVNASNYNYNKGTSEFTLSMPIEGNSTFVIKAANSGGNVSKEVKINCQPKQPVPLPEVTVVSPSSSPVVVEDCKADLSVRVKNVASQNNIVVLKDGKTLEPSNYTYNPSTYLLNLSTSFSDKTSFIIRASNETGTIEKTIQFECKPKTEPVVTNDQCGCNKTIIAPPQFYYNEYNVIPAGNNNLTVNQGDKVILLPGTTFNGSIQMNGGSLAIGGKADISAINFNAGEIVNLGTTTFSNINMNNASSSLKNYGSISFTNITFNGTVENNGSMAVSQDFNINSSATFINTGTTNISGSLNNNNRVLNKGGVNVSNKVQNNGSGEFTNHCQLNISNEFLNNSLFTNYGRIVVSAYTTLNSGKLSMKGGSTLVTGNLTVNATIEGESTYCSSIKVGGKTILNSSARITGKAEICDNNGIEQNNISYTSTCACPAKACGDVILPTPTVPEVTIEEKVTICHYPPGNTNNPQTLSIPKSALQAHLNHGDKMGTCEDIKKAEDEAKQKAAEAERIRKEAEEKAKQLEIEKQQKEAEANKVNFNINNGTVVPSQCYNASVTVIGCALKEGGVGIDYPVVVQVKFGNTTVDPFGSYSGYNKSSNVNDNKIHTWQSPTAIAANTAISVKAKSFNPKSTSTNPLYERNSANNDPFAKVLRNGDVVPKISGFAGQANVESFLQNYIVNGKVKLDANQAIYLFELGTNSTSSQSYDLQDCVVLVTLSPSACPSANALEEKIRQDALIEQQRKEAEEKAKQLEIQKQKEAEEKAKAEQERIRKEAEDKAEKERIEKERLENEEKVTICHYPPGNTDNPQTLSVPKSALQAHLNHGDKLGTCEAIKQADEKAKHEAEEKAKAEQERIRKEAEEKAKLLELQKQQKEAEEKARRDAEEKVKAEQERIRKEAEEKAEKEKLENEEKVTICHYPPGNPDNPQTLSIPKSALQAHLNHGDKLGTCEAIKQAEEKAKHEAEEKAKAEQERIRKEVEEKAKQLELQRQQKEAEEKVKAEQERIRKESEEKAKRDVEEKAKIEQERVRKEAEEKARQLEIQRQQQDAAEQERIRKEAEEKARQQELQKQQQEAAEKARLQEIERQRKAAEEKARHEAEEKAKMEQERIRKEAEEKAQQHEQEKPDNGSENLNQKAPQE